MFSIGAADSKGVLLHSHQKKHCVEESRHTPGLTKEERAQGWTGLELKPRAAPGREKRVAGRAIGCSEFNPGAGGVIM